MPNTFWAVIKPNQDGYVAVCETQETAILHIVNRFGKASGFDIYTFFKDMFYWSKTNKAWTWKGNFQNGIYVKELEYDRAVLKYAEELTISPIVPSGFLEMMKEKELTKYD